MSGALPTRSSTVTNAARFYFEDRTRHGISYFTSHSPPVQMISLDRGRQPEV